MNIICEICDNKDHNYLPYLMKEEYYTYLRCFLCNKTINICYNCKKYLWIKPTYGNVSIPRKYDRVVNELCKYSYSKCKKCWS